MSIFWTITEYIATLIENWIIYDFYKKFHTAKNRSLLQKIIYFAFIIITSAGAIAIDYFTSFSGMMTLICIGVIILYGIIFLNGSIFSKFFLPVATFGMIFVINISFNIICAYVLNRDNEALFSEQDTVRFFSIIITKFMLFLLTRIVLGIFQKGVILKKQEWITLSVISLISLLIGISVVSIRTKPSEALSIPYIICIGGIICIDLFVFIMLLQISKQNQKITQVSLLELQISQQKHALEHMDIMQNKIRQCNHDHLNHLLCLQEMIQENNYEEVSSYLKELVQKNPEVHVSHVQIPDHFLRAILTVKMEQCKQKNIVVSLKTDDTMPRCESSDLCVLLSNLLDNALEASEKIHNPKIEIILSKQKDYYTVVVKNRIDESVLKRNVHLKTTKKNKMWHGIGIQSIREIVNRYNGMMEYYEKDDWFIANIWLRET